MGNHKFRLSEMIPNAWFYKLKYMNYKPSTNYKLYQSQSLSAITKLQKHHLPPPPPPPSSPPTPAKKPTIQPPPPPPPSHFTRTHCESCLAKTMKHSDKDNNFIPKGPMKNPSNDMDFQLPPILTKPRITPKSPRRPSTSSPRGGMRLRRAVAAVGPWKGQNGNYNGGGRMRKLSERMSSMAVVKASRDPQKDFKESMVEMIVENHLTETKDLEDLLVSYLSLNSNEYHHLIIKVFEHIWLDLRNSS